MFYISFCLCSTEEVDFELPNQGTSPSYSDSEESTAFWEEEHTKRLLRIQAKGKVTI